MDHPPAKPAPTEQALSRSEAQKIPCTGTARSIIKSYEEAALQSEQATLCPDFGHIYRYKVMDFDQTPPEVSSIVILWTTNQDTFEIASTPTFELPGELFDE